MNSLTEEEIIKGIDASYEFLNQVLQAVPSPLVSVWTSTYQHGPYIRECIEGILAQKTNFPFEYIIGEDFSTDGTREIVLDYARKYPHIIRVITADFNVGSKANGRRCMQACRGKYLAFCEGDDYWHSPYKLQRQIDVLEHDSAVSLVCTDVDASFVKTGRRIHRCMKRSGQLDKVPISLDMTASLLKREINLYACTACMYREQYLRIRSENTYEFSSHFKMGDVQTWWELSRLGKVVVIPESMVTYRVLTQSASHSQDRSKTYDFYVNSLVLHEHYVKKFGYEKDMLDAVRKAHYGILLDIALRLRSEGLRRRTLELIPKVPANLSLSGRIMAQGAQTPARFKQLAMIWPPIAFFCKVWSVVFRKAQRLRSCASLCTCNVRK